MTGDRVMGVARQTQKNRFLAKETGFFVHSLFAANRPYYWPSTLPIV